MSVLFILLTATINPKLSLALCGSGNTKNSFIFANGMFNDFADAKKSQLTTIRQIKMKHPDINYQKTDIAYNTNENIILQFNQVFRQKFRSFDIGFWSNLGKLFNKKNSSLIRKIKTLIINSEAKRDTDLQKQILKYKNLLSKDFHITTVAHSQGNFYTNMSFEKINSEDLNMVSVATPDNRVYMNGPYYTFKSDRVMAYMSGALKPNVTKTEPGHFDHKYVGDYLQDTHTGNLILNSIYEYYKKDSGDRLSENSSYFNADMKPLLIWYNKNINKNRKLKKSDCLITQAIFDLFMAYSISCEKRNLSSVKRFIKDCEADFKDESKMTTLCPFYRGLGNPSETYWTSSESMIHYQSNPICQMSFKEFKKDGLLTVKLALETINKLYKEKRKSEPLSK